MKRNLFFGALLVAGLALLGLFALSGPVRAQLPDPGSGAPPASGVTVGQDSHHDTSPPLRDMPQLPPKALPERDATSRNPLYASAHKDVADTVVQRLLAPLAMPATILNFDGVPFPGVVCNCAPPDTNGEVGQTQYLQMVNEGYQVFNKATGASVLGPASIASVWTGFGGVCQNNGHGDPVVLYDQLANRWLISQFAGTTIPTDECIAVSTGNDATGAWNRYDFTLGTNFFDYPHIGVWPDAYYMGDNVFDAAGSMRLGPQPFAFNRAAMLAGTAATFVSTGLLAANAPYMLPGDFDGSILPPAGAANPFLGADGATWPLYRFHVDFVTPANSTFTLAANLTPAGYTQLCPATRACVPELGGELLDGIGDRGMFRSAYRHFADGHEALVGNKSVSSGTVAGIRWWEINNVTAGAPGFVQQSTYQPDTTWRWMGSIAQDANGAMALGFSASSATINPQIRYAGRLATDPLNTLAQGEATLFAGTGSQLPNTGNRWGDYSDMTVDPVDDCTFWYTQEYYQTSGSFNWRTRIGNFKYANCPAVALSATPTATPGGPTATATATAAPATTTPTAGAATATATATCLVPQNYSVTTSTNAIVPGTTDIGNHCDDCNTSIALPFPVSLYGTTYNNAAAGSNGYLAFGTADNFFYAGCLPDATATYNIFPFAVDQITGAAGNYGIFTLTNGVAPNRTFYIEWRACRYNGATTCLANSDANYEVVFQEGVSNSFAIRYGVFGTANATVGAIGVQRDNTFFIPYSCNAGAPPATTQLTFTLAACATPTATVFASPTLTPVCPPAAWSAQAVYPSNIMDNAVAAQGGNLYSFAGYNGAALVANAYKYTPATNTWAAIAPLPAIRENASAVSDGTYIYILGGADSTGVVQNTLYRYDPVANTYLTEAPFTTATFAQAAAYLNGKIYRISGCTTPCSATTNTVEAYTIGTNTWAPVAVYPTPGGFIQAVGFGGFVYAGGGVDTTGTATAKTYRYDPVGNTWDDAAVTDLPVARWGGSTSILNGRWVIATGFVGGVVSNSAVALDLSAPAGAWATLPNALVALGRNAGDVINSDFYVVGGENSGSFTPTNNHQRYREVLCVTPSVTPTGVPATLTATAVPPTLTRTAVPPTLTVTPVPPTLTATAVPPTLTTTPVPPTLTTTPVPPTLTATAVPPTLTRTAVPPTLTATVVGATATATATACPLGQTYNTTVSTGATVVPATVLIPGSQGDDNLAAVTLPFPYTLYDTSYNTAQVSTNGALFFGTANGTYAVTCIPNGLGTYVIAPYWADLYNFAGTAGCASMPNGCGIFTSTSGTAPNRIFNIEYHEAYYLSNAVGVDFEVRLYEGQTRFDIVYGSVTPDTQADDSALTVGVQKNPTTYTSIGCDTTGGTVPPVSTGQMYVYTLACIAPSPTPSNTPTLAGTVTSTSTATATPVCPPAAWSAQAVYPSNIMDNAVAAQGGNLYSFAGYTGAALVANAYKYTPATNTWAAIAPLPAIRENASAVSDGTYIYILGGADSTGVVQNTLYRYDPVANTYLTEAPFTTATFAQAAAYLNGKIYRISGCTTPCSVTTNTVEAYTIGTNSWAPVAVYPTPGGFIQAVGFGGFVYAGGGVDTTGTATAKTYRYDPVGNTWDDAAVTDLPAARWGGSTSILNGRWVIATGFVGGVVSNSAVALDLSAPAGAWAPLPNALVALGRNAGDVINSDFYVVGGENSGSFTPTNNHQRYREVNCVTPSVTPTGVPATLTATAVPPTLTRTAVPPTLTTTPVPPTLTATAVPPTLTTTPVPPTLTATAVPPTLTATAVPPTLTATVVGATATATATACPLGSTYNTTVSTGATVVPATVLVPGSQGDDVTAAVALPFAYTLYDTTGNNVTVGSNGGLFFATANGTYAVTCIPNALSTYTIAPYWDDLNTSAGLTGCASMPNGCGIFTSTSGTAPNRIFNIEWHAAYYSSNAVGVDFEVRLYEGQSRFDIVYGSVTADTVADDSQLTVGVQKNPTTYTSIGCDTTGGTAPPVSTGQMYVYTLACVAPSPTASNTPVPPTVTRTATPVGATATSTVCAPQAAGWSAGAPFSAGNIVRGLGLYYPTNGNFYVVGGRLSDVAGSDYLNPHEYTPATNTWITRTAVFTDAQVNNMAGGVLTGLAGFANPVIVAVGGSAAGAAVATNVVRVYDPLANTITTLSSDPWPGDADGVTLPGGFAVVNNKLYVLGGFHIGSTGLTTIYRFDPAAAAGSRWTLMPTALPVALAYIPAAAIGGVIYTGGGDTVAAGALTDSTNSYVYDPVANTIAPLANQIPRATGETRGLNVGGKLWVLGGGRTAPNPSNEVDIYDPVAGTWSVGLPFTGPRRNFPADTDGTHVYLVGGYEPATPAADMQIFNPAVACGTVTATPTAPASTATRTATVVPGTNTATPAATATCGGPTSFRFLIVFSDLNTQPATLRTQMLAEAGVSAVDTFDAGAGTPTLAQLQPYTEVVVFSNSVFSDPITLGNNLADYQDGGGIVVATTFDWYGPPFGLDGRWMTAGYTPFTYPGAANFTSSNLGTYTAGHPLMAGVTTLTATYRETMGLTAGATQIAAWQDNTPLLAVKTTGGHTAVAISSYMGDGAGQWSGQFGKLIVNAARWLAPAPPCGSVSPTPTASNTGTATPTATPGTPSATPTCGGAGTPAPWVTVSPIAQDAYGMSMDSDGTNAYEGGGYSFTTSGQITQFSRYNPTTNVWTTLSPVPDSTNGLASMVYAPINNKLYMFGGDDATTGTVVNTTRIYDPATGLWSTGAPMPDVRAFMASGYYNGKIYLVGGYSTGNVTPAFAQVWEYDPLTNTFNTSRLDMPHALGGASYGVIAGHLYVAGGRDAANLTLNSLYDYNIAANTWATGANLPVVDNVPGHAVISGQLWVFGGGNPFTAVGHNQSQRTHDVPTTINATYIYDPGTNTWATGPTLNIARSFPGGTNIGNRAIAVGGYTGSTTTTSVETSTNAAPCPTTATVTPVAPSATPTNTATVVPNTPTLTTVPSVTPANTATTVPNTPTLTTVPTQTPGAATATTVPTDTATTVPTGTGTPQPPTATATVCVMTFSDVPVGYWAYGYIKWAYCHGIVSGYSDGTFRPENDTTRAQIAKMVVLAAQFPLVLPPGAPHFTDVPPSNPFYTYIEVAYAHGVISGYGDGTFRPYHYVTRAQLSKMIVVARGLPLVTPPVPTYNDVPASYWAYRYIETATAHNIVGGYTCGGPGEPCPGRYFRPDTYATRAQLCKMLYQAFGIPSRAAVKP